MHGAVGEHHIVGSQQLVQKVYVGHVVVVGVEVDCGEVVPVAEVGEEFLHGVVVEYGPEKGVADDDERGVPLRGGVGEGYVYVLVALGGYAEGFVQKVVEVGVRLAGSAAVGLAEGHGTDGGAEGLHIAHYRVEGIGQ